MTSSGEVFRRARAEDRAALVGYLPAGFPTYDGCVAALTAAVEAGVDLLEVGLPYSDPVIDGPVIQAAADRALRNGTRTTDVLRTVEALAKSGAAVVVMTYWNPVLAYGAEAFTAAQAPPRKHHSKGRLRRARKTTSSASQGVRFASLAR